MCSLGLQTAPVCQTLFWEIFILSLADSRKHRLHCQNMCSIGCWATLSWGEYCCLIIQFLILFNFLSLNYVSRELNNFPVSLNFFTIFGGIFSPNVHLFLFQPLGFQVDSTKLKRAGLDYWPYPHIWNTRFFPLFFWFLLTVFCSARYVPGFKITCCLIWQSKKQRH